jgi:hypothetical protein
MKDWRVDHKKFTDSIALQKRKGELKGDDDAFEEDAFTRVLVAKSDS